MDGRQRGKKLEENERKRWACLATFLLPNFPWKRKFCATGVHFYCTLKILAKIKMQMGNNSAAFTFPLVIVERVIPRSDGKVNDFFFKENRFARRVLK